MKFLFDLFPIILFFGVYETTKNMFMATGVAIATTVLLVAVALIRGQKVDKLQWLSLVLIVVFGGLTIWLHDPRFIMWKVTILYWLMALGLVIGERFGKNGIRAIMEAQVSLPDDVWRNLCFAWSAFFIIMGFINLAVYNWLGNDLWVQFKLFGTVGLTLAFAIGQSLVLGRYMEEEK